MMLRHQHHSMQRDNRMGGPMRPMQQTNMAPIHQSQHPLSHRNPHQQILQIPPQQHMHHMQHVGSPHGNPRQPLLMGISAHNSNGPMVNVVMKKRTNPVPVTLQNPNVSPVPYRQQNNQPQHHQPHQQPQQQQPMSQTSEQNHSSLDNESEERDLNSSQNHVNVINSSLANIKEKTPMCLLNELARFNKIQHQYRLTNEQGPAHKKRFTVTLKLGEEEYFAEGPSIKKAQHGAATEALTKTWYRQPPPKPTKAMRVGHSGKCPTGIGHLPPTVELNALAMKRGEATIYTFRQAPSTPSPHFVHCFNNVPRMLSPRFSAYNSGFEPQGWFIVCLKVGEREFTGRGVTGQAARHDAASRALEQLRQLPLPEEVSNICPNTVNGPTTSVDDPNSELKSPVSLVYETALKRGLSVTFEVISESGKPHIRTFMTKCTVGDEITNGEGSSKKVSKKRAAELMLEELKRLPPLPVNVQNRSLRLKRKPPAMKKKSRNLIKVYQESHTESETEEVNPVSRLVQIQQSKREREPVYNLIEEKGAPRRREFVMEVLMGQHSAKGSGPNKKLAKRNAADALLTQLGYSKPQPQPTKPSIKNSDSENTETKPRKVTFLEDDTTSNDTRDHPVGGTIGRQLVPGILLVDSGQESKNHTGPSVQVVAEELRGQQQNPTGSSPQDQLKYLAQLFNFNVEFSDFPKGVALNKEYLSLVTLSTDPPQVCHGNGSTIIASRSQAAFKALRTLSKLGLDKGSNSQNRKDKGGSGDGVHIKVHAKNDILDASDVDK